MSTDMPLGPEVAWFDDLYLAADRDPGAVPWADLTPNGWLADWLAGRVVDASAVIVGCGLGDDAERVAAAGYETTAFDVAPQAVSWCRERFPDSTVEYRVADLLDLPADLVGRFELVVEVRTIQSLPLSLRSDAIDGVAALVAPGGSALVVALAGPDGVVPDGPPWAVSESELRRFGKSGLTGHFDHIDSGYFALELSRSAKV